MKGCIKYLDRLNWPRGQMKWASKCGLVVDIMYLATRQVNEQMDDGWMDKQKKKWRHI